MMRGSACVREMGRERSGGRGCGHLRIGSKGQGWYGQRTKKKVTREDECGNKIQVNEEQRMGR